MNEKYHKTGKWTSDGIEFHYAHTNVRIGQKHYLNASEETLRGLGLSEVLLVYVSYTDYEEATRTYDEDDDNFPYKDGFEVIDGVMYYITYSIVYDYVPESENQEDVQGGEG